MKRLFHIFLFSLLALSAWAADPEYYDEPVFTYGEKVKFNLYYNWGFVWIHAGDCNFQVKKGTHSGKEVMSLLVSGTTTKTFDKMYCIRDSFESYLNPENMRPVFYRETKHEDSYYSHTTYDYVELSNGVKVDMKRHKRDKVDQKDIFLDKNTLDLIFSCYNFRNLKTENLKKNQVVPFKMLFDDDVYDLGLTFKGKTTVKLKNGKQYNALKFVPKLITGDLFKKEDDMVIYVSDDQNHIPLMVEAKIKVGWVKAMLSKYENAKYPQTSLKE